jgi:hypothetical protein
MSAFNKNKIIKKAATFLNKKMVVWAIIPILLLVFWVFLSYQYIASKTGVSVLAYPASAGDYISGKRTELLKGEKIGGQFVAKDIHLGIISVRFKTFSRINKDVVIFRIKEKGSEDWLYEHPYLVDQFQDNQYFTFGMPILDNSFGKVYQFEIESVRGKSNDAIALSRIKPIFVTKYKFTKNEILANAKILIKFIFMKTTESLADNDFIAFSTIYLLPFFFYLAIKIVDVRISTFLRKRDVKSLLIYTPLYLIFSGVIITIILAKIVYLPMIFIIAVLWIITIAKYRLEDRVTLFSGGACLLISPFLFLFSFLREAINTATWAYVFLVIATVQALVELKSEKQIYEKD